MAGATAGSAKASIDAIETHVATPPCIKYKNLRTIQYILSMASEYDKAKSQTDIKVIGARTIVFKQALSKLSSALKSATNELAKAQTAKLAAAENSENEKEKNFIFRK